MLPGQSKWLVFNASFLIIQLVVRETIGNVLLTQTAEYKLGDR